jgi:hypothetical protein
MRRWISQAFLLILIFSFQNLFPSSKAKISIIHFVDNTGSKNFTWLKESLADAIDKAMDRTFIYERPNIKKNQKLAERLIPNSQDFYSKQNLSNYCQKAKVDYLIYGSYVLDKSSDEIKIYSGVFSLEEGDIISYIESKIPPDSKMFQKVDNVANTFVESIKEFIEDSEKTSEKQLVIKKDKKDAEQILVSKPGRGTFALFPLNQVQFWMDAGGYVASGETPWLGNTFGIIAENTSNSTGVGSGGGFRLSFNLRYKLLGIQLSTTWSDYYDMEEYERSDGKTVTLPGEGSITSSNLKVGMIFGTRPGWQSSFHVFTGLNLKSASYTLIEKVGVLEPGERSFTNFSPILGIQDITLYPVNSDIALGHVLGFVIGWNFPGEIDIPDGSLSLSSGRGATLQIELGMHLALRQFYFQTVLRLDMTAGQGDNSGTSYVYTQGLGGIYLSIGTYL